MQRIDYKELQDKLAAKGADALARRLKRQYGYNARERKERINPKELAFQDAIAKRVGRPENVYPD